MRRCKRCLYPDAKPDLHFDEAGVCSACRNFDARARTDWAGRERELVALLEKHRRRGAEFDCIVASSGGKDSHHIALELIGRGARPLVVTATTCSPTEIGRANIANLARFATTVEVTPNRSVRARLNRLGLELVGDISWPEHVSIFTTPFRVAVQMGIPLIFYGESPQNQYGGPPGTETAREMTRRWVSEFGGFLGLRPRDAVGQLGITIRDMEDYLPPPASALERAGVEAHFLGQYLPWDSHANAERAMRAGMVAELPFEGNVWPWENLDNAQTGLHDWFGWIKYGYGRACAQLSVDVRAGRLPRDVAEAMLGDLDGRFPHRYAGVPYEDEVERIGLTLKEFWAVAERFTNRDLFPRAAVAPRFEDLA